MDKVYLYGRVCEELDLEKETLAVILYGSRVRDDYKENSDLDILVVTDHLEPYYNRETRLIDGIPVEIVYISCTTLEQTLKRDYWANNTFLESVLLTGEIVYNPHNIFAYFFDLIVKLRKNKKYDEYIINPEWERQLYFEIEMFKNFDGNKKKYHYYNLIEVIRLIYHNLYNCSVITPFKLNDLYTNEEKAKDIYLLTLPSNEFRDTYLEAINATDMEKSVNELLKFIDYKYKDLMIPVVEDYLVEVINPQEILNNMMHLGKTVYVVEDLILHQDVSSEFAYFQLMTLFSRYSRMLSEAQRDEFNKLFEEALNNEGIEDRIRVIEELYHMYSLNYEFDIDDFKLLRYR